MNPDTDSKSAAAEKAQHSHSLITADRHHSSCLPSDRDLVWHCNQCGINEASEFDYERLTHDLQHAQQRLRQAEQEREIAVKALKKIQNGVYDQLSYGRIGSIVDNALGLVEKGRGVTMTPDLSEQKECSAYTTLALELRRAITNFALNHPERHAITLLELANVTHFVALSLARGNKSNAMEIVSDAVNKASVLSAADFDHLTKNPPFSVI